MTDHAARTGAGLEGALRKLREEIVEGLQHGFFELAVSCEIIQGHKRRFTIKAGKSYQFVLSEAEVNAGSRN
ncbi:MAG: hypothetical protein R6X16_03635 [Anaerolineae bacterium]